MHKNSEAVEIPVGANGSGQEGRFSETDWLSLQQVRVRGSFWKPEH